jgi:CHAD domain-containing protein
VLRKTWHVYEKKVHLSKNHTSPKNIHQLRISIQKLEAILTLANSLHSTHHSKNIMALIINVRKNLGPLRDIQVESLAIENLRDENMKDHKHRKFSTFFTKQKRKAKKKAESCLEKISIEKESKRTEKLVQKLEKIELSHDQTKIKKQLNLKMKLNMIKFNHMMKNVNPKKIKEIHHFRIMAKKLRYQSECMNTLTGLARYDLPQLKRVQSVAGRIQNDSMLISTLDQFLENKKNKHDPQVLKIKKRILDQQKKLISQDFMKLTTLNWPK